MLDKITIAFAFIFFIVVLCLTSLQGYYRLLFFILFLVMWNHNKKIVASDSLTGFSVVRTLYISKYLLILLEKNFVEKNFASHQRNKISTNQKPVIFPKLQKEKKQMGGEKLLVISYKPICAIISSEFRTKPF